MTKNAVKELMRAQKKQKDNALGNEVITEVNKLLEYDNHRDLEILRSIGMQSTLVQAENKKGAAIELEKKEDFYSGTIFTRDQIETLAVKYRLKFLRSRFYQSYIDPTVAMEVKNLERAIAKSMEKDQANKRGMSVEEYRAENGETKYNFDAYTLKEKFFVLAPAKCFALQKVSKFTPDPVLFYTDDNKHSRLIKKWGSDFTIFRRLIGLHTKSRPAMFWTTVFLLLTLGVASIPFLGLYSLLFLFAFPVAAIYTYPPGARKKEYFGKLYVITEETY